MKYFKAFGLVALLVVLSGNSCYATNPTPSLPGTLTPTSTPSEPVTSIPDGTLTPTPTLFVPATVIAITPPATIFIPPPVTPSATVFIPPTVTATPRLFVPVPVAPPPPPTVYIPQPAPPTIGPTKALSPGVYIQNMRLNPPNAKQKQDITFIVRFFNNTGREQEYSWFVYIYLEGKTTPMGQTSWAKAYKIPPGVSELASFNTWRVGGGQPCTNYVGKVHWLRADGAKPAFSNTAGREYSLRFTVCP